MTHRTLLVVDDERDMLDVCQEILEGLEDVSVRTCDRSPEALELIKDQGMDLLVADIAMPDLTGLDLLRAVREVDKNLPVLLITGYPTVDTAVQALRLGAADYLTKPFHPDELLETARRLLDTQRLRSENYLLSRHVARAYRFGDMVGASVEMGKVFSLIESVAPSDVPVLITGETGTGKELVARAIHQGKPDGRGRFVPVDCGAIPENLLESEFFGYEAGAFTGANQRSIGLMEYADGGVLFLDEIAELPVHLQAKLLRALQEHRIRRIGGRREIVLNLRLIAATNRNLEEEVAEGRFREDLYYRLNVVKIAIPPLRDRSSDIPLIIAHFLRTISDELRREPPVLDKEALEVLCSYSWPGNVRELQNAVRRMLVLTKSDVLQIQDLPETVVLNAQVAMTTPAHGFFQERALQAEKFEREYFEAILTQSGGNVTRAAEVAGVPRGTLYRLLKRCALDPNEFRPN